MCGINAVYDATIANSERAALVSLMNQEMVYRGPDGQGIFSDGPVTMGMRRLSIIDVGGGQQPLFNEDRTLALVCNGEIYNHLELRIDLESRGHRFSTGSDCETILHLYEEMGDGCVERLRGMFSFALWDTRRSRLLAARDRLGIKPLYLARRGHALAFSSELKSLVKAGYASAAIDYAVLYQTVRHTYPIDERRTVARDVDRLPPGSLVVVDAEGMHERRYWSPRFGASEAEPSDQALTALLEETVQLHLRSDVPIAILLSAGIDSAAIAAIVGRSNSEVVALCAGYRGEHASDEREGAKATARAIGVRCLEVEIDAAEFPAIFEKLTKCCDEPPCDVASMAQWALYSSCRALDFKVVLSGIGGDEIFFGYPVWNEAGEQLGRHAAMERVLPSPLGALVNKVGYSVPRLRRWLMEMWPGQWTGLDRSDILVNNERVLRWLGADPAGESSSTADDLVLSFERMTAPGPDALYAFLTAAYLPNNGLLLADKLGMGCSVEVRVPFADHVLVEQVVGLPLDRRFSSRHTKPLLRRLLHSLVPPNIMNRPKQGFTPPPTFVETIVRENAEAILSSPEIRSWLNIHRLETMIRGFLGAGEHPPRPRSRSMIQRARAIVGDEPHSAEVGWALYSLAAFVRSHESWR